VCWLGKGFCRSAANNEEVFLTKPRRHVKDKYPFGNSTPNFPPKVPFLLRRAILQQGSETNGLSYIYKVRLLLCRTMEINAVGNFPAQFLGSWSAGHLSHLDLPFLIASLVVYLP